MKLKDLINQSKNKSNNQLVWNPKKREIKKAGLSTEKILDMKINLKELIK